MQIRNELSTKSHYIRTILLTIWRTAPELENFNLIKFHEMDEERVKNCIKMLQKKTKVPLDDIALNQIVKKINFEKSGCKKVWRFLLINQNDAQKHEEL